MNLSVYVDDKGKFDYQALRRDSKIAMRFMDNVIDANFYFHEENEKVQKNIRRTGLGTMGLGDTLIKMKIKYGSDESLSVIKKIYRTIRDSAYEASVLLAKEKGSFPLFDKDKYLQAEFIKSLPSEIRGKIAKYGIRNAVLLTQAPTGTTSLLAGVSSGIEPNYDFEFKRVDRTGEHIIYHPLYKQWVDANPGKKIPEYFVGAKQLLPEDHVKVQALIQRYTDSSISKTVNAPESYTVLDVKRLYNLAYDLGCKGITFFRDGSRLGVLSSLDSKEESVKSQKLERGVVELRLRPKQLSGETYEIRTPLGSAFITINADVDGNPFEMFLNVGKAGSHIKADAEAIGRLISLSLRVPSELPSRFVAEAIVDQLSGIGGSESVGFGNGKVRSLADGVAKVLKKYLDSVETGTMQTNKLFDETDNSNKDQVVYQRSLLLVSKKRDLCPECGQASWVMEEGCSKCYSCGASKC
jgi:ribonucleoside-diphosphate reductase alpha chain